MVTYQSKTMIAYAIVRHHPDKKIIRAILSSIVSDPSDRTDPNDPHAWRDTFQDILENMETHAYNVHAVLEHALMDAGPCPRLVTIPDILHLLDIEIPPSPR